MLIGELLKGTNITGVFRSYREKDDGLLLSQLHVTGIATDSSAVCPGDVFVCIRGSHTDGHLYAGEAVRRGAAAVVAERVMRLGVPMIVTDNTRRTAAFMWNNRYGDPARNMTLIAVTGTNGKTSVSYMIREILRCAGYKCGLIGTVKSMAGERELSFGGGSEITGAAAAMTTPDPRYLYRMLYEMRLAGVTHAVMEASSHALSQHKLAPLEPSIALFTGLSAEHLDYHGNMENYFSAKSVLFRQARSSIINFDDPWGKRLCDMLEGGAVKAGTDPDACNVCASEITTSPGEVSYTLRAGGTSARISCPMPGRFGLYNSLLAASAAMEAGVSTDCITDALRHFGGVPGRMETVARHGKLTVIRDFAHTPEAMRSALEILAGEKIGKLWVVFGCGGDRDRAKRPEMGRIAAKMADFTVITSDNPRGESRDKIIAEIMGGFDRSKPHRVIPDRESAIRYAIAEAADGDTVLLLGKGHENYEITAEGKRPFDEAAIAASAINERTDKEKEVKRKD